VGIDPSAGPVEGRVLERSSMSENQGSPKGGECLQLLMKGRGETGPRVGDVERRKNRRGGVLLNGENLLPPAILGSEHGEMGGKEGKFSF